MDAIVMRLEWGHPAQASHSHVYEKIDYATTTYGYKKVEWWDGLEKTREEKSAVNLHPT